MKHIKQFKNYQQVNEGVGLALLAGTGLVLAAGPIYDWARSFWSKNVIGSKYTETGKVEKVVTKLPQQISTYVVLSIQDRERGEVVTELKEYKDKLGNIYWGYDHLWSPDDYADYYEYLQSADKYTAMYKVEDFEDLKKFLVNPERYTGKGGLYKPNPVDMIYIEEGPRDPGGNY